MKAASLLLLSASVCSSSSPPNPDEGRQSSPKPAQAQPVAEPASADGAPEPEPAEPEPPAAATGPTKPMRVRVPGAPLRDLGRLAKITECAAAPAKLQTKDRDAIGRAAAAYAAGRDVEAAGVILELVGGLESDAPAAVCHLTYQTMVAAEPALARVAGIHAYDTRRLAELEVRLTDLRKKMTRTEPKIAVTITRWRSEPGDAGADESAEADVQLVRTELKREIEHLKALRKLVQVRLEVVAGMLDAETTNDDALLTKLQRAEKSAKSQSGTKAREVAGLLERVAGPAPTDLFAEARTAATTIAEVEAAMKHAVETEPKVEPLLETAAAKSQECIDRASAKACVELATAAERLATTLANTP